MPIENHVDGLQSEGRKNRIPDDIRLECLRNFEKGYGYKKTAAVTGVNRYTVRDYLRRYKAGDLDWVDPDSSETGL